MIYIFFDFLIMHSLSYLFYILLKKFNLENKFLGNLSFNLTRSVICGSLAYYSYKKIDTIYIDKCLDNKDLYNSLQIYHRSFLNYFIYDIFVMIYQVYKNINTKIRMDLLFHHLFAIFVLNILEYNKMYNISLLIGISEGMSIVSGLKLLSLNLNLGRYNSSSFKLFISLNLQYLPDY